jgi:hypothetical protein
MPFEVFSKRRAATSGRAYVSLQKKGIFALNHAAFALLGEPAAVELLFDVQHQIIGFRASDADSEHAYAVRLNAKGTSHLISGTLFAKHYGIPIDQAQRWPVDLEDGVLCAHIANAPDA